MYKYDQQAKWAIVIMKYDILRDESACKSSNEMSSDHIQGQDCW